jgi:MFS family permease
MALTTFITEPWHAYITLGFMVVGLSVILSYVGHSMVLPNWFIKKRGFAIGIAFSGVGIGSIILLPLVQQSIDQDGWRYACWFMAALLVIVVVPLNFVFQRFKPADLQLLPDGDAEISNAEGSAIPTYDNVVDNRWVETEWTLPMAIRTPQFWWLSLGCFMGLYIWYGILVHQTKYLVDIGVGATEAAFVLGLVGFAGVAGQIFLGYASDRIGREWIWSLSALGFGICYILLLVMKENPLPVFIYLMAISQGLLGYGLASVYGAMPADMFQGKHYGSIFGTLSLSALTGGAIGPWAMGYMYDHYGNYDMAFLSALGATLITIVSIWMAGPRKIRLVAGQAEKRATLKAAQQNAATDNQP